MPTMVPSPALVEEYSDMVIACDDGVVIPCVRFSCVTSCSAIAHVVEDTLLDTDPKGRGIVPFPGVDSNVLGLALDIIHGIRNVEELSESDCVRALDGFGILGHELNKPAVLARLWGLSKNADLDLVMRHADELLHHDTVRTSVLRRLVVLRPVWSQFTTDVLSKLTLDLSLAVWILRVLPAFFAAGPLFAFVIDRVPETNLSLASIMKLVYAPESALHLHPGEVVDVMRAVMTKVRQCGLDSGVSSMLSALVSASVMFDAVPYSANKVYGTTVMLDGFPCASLLLSVDTPICVARKMSPWLTMTVNKLDGILDLCVAPCKLDDPGRFARNFDIRVTAYSKTDTRTTPATQEVWFEAKDVDPNVQHRFSMANLGRPALLGCKDAMRAAVRESSKIRVDVFYAKACVLHKPLF
jgi:hypothetical protein